MVYLQYNREVQDVYIPRQNTIDVSKVGIDLSMYLTSGQTVELIDEAISGITVDLSDYYTSAETNTAIQAATENLITSGDAQEQINSSLSGYATEQWVESQGYLTEHQSLSAYSTTEEMNSAISSATEDMATKTWVGQQGYLTEHQSLSAYSTTVQVEGMISAATEDFVTSADVKTQIESYNYITASDLPDVSEFVTSADVKTQVEGYNYVNSGQVQTQIDNSISGISIDLSNYYTSAETESAISDAVENFVTSAEVKTQIESYNYITASDLPDVSDFVTSADVKTQVEGYNYITSADAKTQIEEYNYTTSSATKTQIESYNYVNSGQVQTQIEESLSGVDLSNYYTSAQTESAISEATVDFITSADAKTQIESYNYITSAETSGLSADIATLSGKVQADEQITASAITDLNNRIPDLTNYYTSAQTNTAINSATSGFSSDIATLSGKVQTNEQITAAALANLNSTKQDTLVSGTNIKTINNESILGSGNIEIQGGGGGETVVELTKAQYEALTAYSQDTTYIITDADVIDITDYATSAETAALSGTVSALTATVDTKADKATVSANSNYYFPAWNNQGIITGTTGNRMYQRNININGSNQSVVRTTNSDMGTIYAPTTAGSAGQLVTSNGSGAPVWTSFKFWFGTQNDYDAITTKDSTCIYFITD